MTKTSDRLSALASDVDDLEKALDEKNARIGELEQEVDRLKSDLSAAQVELNDVLAEENFRRSHTS